MLTLVQLADGCYKLVIEFSTDGFRLHREFIFAETEFNAEPLDGGDRYCFELSTDK